MSYWPEPTDQTKDCRCGCGRQVGVYNKGITKDFYSDSCYEEALGKAVKSETDSSHAKYTEDDVYRGKNLNDSDLTQREHNKAQLRQKAAKARMLGFESDAKRIEGMIA